MMSFGISFKNCINIDVNCIRMVKDRKTPTPDQKKIYRKHYKVRGILIEALPH